MVGRVKLNRAMNQPTNKQLLSQEERCVHDVQLGLGDDALCQPPIWAG